MASEKRRASITGRDSATLAAKMKAVSTAATPKSSREKRARPVSKAVSAGRSARPAAILPNAVRVPVDTTTAVPEPWWTTVPM